LEKLNGRRLLPGVELDRFGIFEISREKLEKAQEAEKTAREKHENAVGEAR
jgi:hypothetical protein